MVQTRYQIVKIEGSGPSVPQMETLGFDFGTLPVSALTQLAVELGISILNFKGPKPLKGDYIFFAERHFAL